MKLRFLLLSTLSFLFLLTPKVFAGKSTSRSFFAERRSPTKPMSYMGFSLGPRWLMTHKPTARDYFSFSFSGHRDVLSRQAEINYRVTAGFNTNFSAGDISGTLGANYFFLQSAVAPYAGLDFGLGFMSFQDERNNHAPFGFIGGPRVGTRFFRKSDKQLDVSFAATFLFRDVGGKLPIFLELKLGVLI